MPYLYLIRHPRTHVDPNRQAHEWQLSDQGRAQVEALLEASFWPGVVAVYSSNQMKSIEPAKLIAARYNISVSSIPGLAEVQRGTELYHSTSDYNAMLSRFFSAPETPIIGWERTTDALARFQKAVQEILEQHPGESVGLVSHGIVLALYSAMLSHQKPTLPLWRAIDFASVAAVDVRTMTLISPFVAAPYTAVPVA